MESIPGDSRVQPALGPPPGWVVRRENTPEKWTVEQRCRGKSMWKPGMVNGELGWRLVHAKEEQNRRLGGS